MRLVSRDRKGAGLMATVSANAVNDRLTTEINNRADQLKRVRSSVLNDAVKAVETHPALTLTEAEVMYIRAAAAAAGGGSTPTPPPDPGTPVTPPPIVTPPPTPPTGTTVPAGSTLKTVFNAASSGQTIIAAPGDHTYPVTFGIIYGGLKVPYTNDAIGLYGPDANLKPAGLSNGYGTLGDDCFIKGEPSHPIKLFADAGGPAADSNGSAMVGVNGVPANDPDAPTRNFLIQDFELTGAAVMNVSQQMLYMNGQLIGLTARRGVFWANGSGGFGLHHYHDGAGPSDAFLFEDLDFHDFGSLGKSPVVLWSPVTNVIFRRCRFIGTTATRDVRLGTGGTVRFEACVFGSGKGILNEGTPSIVDGGGNTNFAVH